MFRTNARSTYFTGGEYQKMEEQRQEELVAACSMPYSCLHAVRDLTSRPYGGYLAPCRHAHAAHHTCHVLPLTHNTCML